MKSVLLLVVNEIKDNFKTIILIAIINSLLVVALSIYGESIAPPYIFNVFITLNFTYLHVYASISSDREDSIFFALKALPINSKQYYYSKVLYNLFVSYLVFICGLITLVIIGNNTFLLYRPYLIISLLAMVLFCVACLVSIFINYCNHYIIPVFVFLNTILGYFLIKRNVATKHELIMFIKKTLVYLQSDSFLFISIILCCLILIVSYKLFVTNRNYKIFHK